MKAKVKYSPPGLVPDIPDAADRSRHLTRLMGKLDIDQHTGCWIWGGYIQDNGYGKAWDGEKVQYTHRIFYRIFFGEIEKGLDIDHLCRNRACVNPLHLEAVTRSVNLRRGDAGENLAVVARKQTHCKRGHEFTPENTRIYRGRRHCRACARMRHQHKDS